MKGIEFKVTGRYALFSDPLCRVGGEKFSYAVPTYEALKGICESVYWKPTFVWVIDECRVMNRILTEAKGIRPIKYSGGNDLANYTYLRDVEYRVKAHFEWVFTRENLEKDRNIGKHIEIAKRALKKGGRRDVFLGTRECQGYVEPCSFSEGEGYYDNTSMHLGIMYHGLSYPDIYNTKSGTLETRLWMATMEQGVIKFPHPMECQIIKPGPATNTYKTFTLSSITDVDTEGASYGVD